MEVPLIFLNRILAEAAKKSASDLHLTVGNLPIARINGELVTLEGENIVTAETVDDIINSFISKEEKQQFQKNKELILVKNLANNFRFRINLFRQKNLPSLSFHYLPATIRGLAELKLPPAFIDLTKRESGLIIIAGPYGSGKTSTVMAFVEEINKTEKKHIVTVENPIEQIIVSKKSLVEQRQLGSDVNSVCGALEYCLNEDVDLIYLSEVGKEFAAALPLILELAAGNCLLVMEMNADSSIRVIEKLLNASGQQLKGEAARYSLADILLGVIIQKLLPRRGGGMILASEILLVNAAVKSLIREGRIYQLESVLQTSRREGMISLDKAIEELINAGEIKSDELK